MSICKSHEDRINKTLGGSQLWSRTSEFLVMAQNASGNAARCLEIGTSTGRTDIDDTGRYADGWFKVLAVDLLNPSPAAEARKHKLKVRRDAEISSIR
jgi:hypothetical protein